MSGRCSCRYCAPAAAEPTRQEQAPPAPVELPAEPRRFRVHRPDRAPLDATLHPDGMVTTIMVGALWRSAFTFDEMRAMDWEHTHIEWDPDPLLPADNEQPTRHPAVEGTQETLV